MREKQKRSFAGKLLFLVSIAIAVSVLLGIAAGYVSPATFWPLAFFGLAFLYLYPVNLFFLFYYALRKRNHIIVPLLPALLGFTVFIKSANLFSPGNNKTDDAIKVMSLNVRLFDLYNWSHNRETRAQILEFLKSESPDILCFQEYYTEDSDVFNNTDTLVELLNLPYYQYHYTTHRVHNTKHWGIILFSRYPITSKGVIEFSKKASNTCVYADIKYKDDTIRVYNVHLESIRFKKPDYEYVEDLKDNIEDKNWGGLRRIYGRLKNAFIKRASETDKIVEHLKECTYPIIFCGDFNDPPSSYTYRSFSSVLNDSFDKGERGFGATYNGPFPAFRIDYILHSKEIEVISSKVINNKLSDHRPVIAFLKLKK